MGTLGCVVPVNWEKLTKCVIPGWIEVINGKRSYWGFLYQFAPYRLDLMRLLDYPDPIYPENYLRSIGWPTLDCVLHCSSVRLSEMHANLDTGTTDLADTCLESAIKHFAAAELPGRDSMRDALGAYLPSRPDVLVAGFGSWPGYLETLFDSTWEESWYLQRSKGLVDNQTELSLAQLFLGCRTLPGISVLPKDYSWPAYDDNRIMGYLKPQEVQFLEKSLNTKIGLFEGPYLEEFELFIDRVRKAARENLSLITLHGGLED